MESLSFEITAELKKLTKGLNRASAQIEDFSKRNEDRLKKFGESATRIGQGLSVGLSLPLLALGANAVKTFSTFDDQMRKVGATMGATDEQLQKLTNTAKELGSSTRFTAREAAEGLEFMALAGFNAEQSIAAIPDVLNLAAAAAIDLGMASDIVTDTMSAFTISADKAGNVSDVLAKTQASANTTVLQLGEAFKFSTANASTFGQDLETLSAILGVFADSGVKGSRAGTAFNAMIRDLKASAKNGMVAIAGQNIALADSQGNFRDLLAIMGDVEKATAKLTQSQRASALDAIFQEEAIRGVNILMTQGVSKAEALRKKLLQSGGSAAKMAEQMEGGLGGALRSLQASFEGFSIELGEALAPTVQKIANFLGKILSKFQNFDSETKKIIIVVGSLVAALGPLFIIIGTIASALPAIISGFALLTGPIGLVVAGVVALTYAIIKNWDTIKEWAEGLINYFVDLYNESAIFRVGIEMLVLQFKNIIAVGTFVFKSLWTIVKTNFKAMMSIITHFGDTLFAILTFDASRFKQGVIKFAASMATNIGGAINDITNNAKTLFDDLSKNAKTAIDNIFQNEDANKVKFSASEESKKKLAEDVANAVSSGVQQGMQGRQQTESVNALPASNGAQQMTSMFGALIPTIRTNLGFITEEMIQFNEDMQSLINGTLSNTFADLGTAIGEALAGGGNIVQNVGQALISNFSRFLSDMGDLLIKYGLFAKAKGAIDVALNSAFGAGTIAAGAAAVGIGIALKAAGAAIGARARGGISGSTGASAGAGAGTSSFSQSFTGGINREVEVRFRASGRDLVGVIRAEQLFQNIIGG